MSLLRFVYWTNVAKKVTLFWAQHIKSLLLLLELSGGYLFLFFQRTGMSSWEKAPNKKWISKEEALAKLQRYCAYQDRCHQEVRSKLLDLGVYGDTLEEVITELIGENFLNEERFAKSYARGKFRLKGWGRVRITQELKRRNVSAYCIRKGLEEIEEAAYQATLLELLEKKAAQLDTTNPFELRSKLYQLAHRKGYESALIQEVLQQIIPEK